MKTIKIIGTLAAILMLSSCNFYSIIGQVDGNGNVDNEERMVSENFSEVKGSAGLDVYLTEGSENKIVVEADENLLEFIETNIANGRLNITTNKNIGRSKSKKVHVTYKKLDEIHASSGADVIGNSVIKNEIITLDASSGSEIEVEVFAREVFAETSSGADINVRGKATLLLASSSSGSDINAKELLVVNCNADASSGGNIIVNVKEKLSTEATSGGSIRYYGNPSAVSNDASRSGNVHKM
ncbi:MAG: hypothetical protein ACI9AT_000142 [Ulvibacter sp.]|jgi:hypothetical protein